MRECREARKIAICGKTGIASSEQKLLDFLFTILINCFPLLFRHVSRHDRLAVLILPSMNILTRKASGLSIFKGRNSTIPAQ